MAPAYLSIWKQCLQELQHLIEVLGKPSEEQAVAERVNAGLTQWLALPALSATDWTALVLELKVSVRLERRGTVTVPTAAAFAWRLGTVQKLITAQKMTAEFLQMRA